MGRPETAAAQRPVIILMSPVAPPIPAKADVPAVHTPVLTVVAEQEDVALPAHLLQAAEVLQVQAEAAEEVPGAAVVVPARLV